MIIEVEDRFCKAAKVFSKLLAQTARTVPNRGMRYIKWKRLRGAD